MLPRGLILGSLAFAAAYGAEMLFSSMGKDIARYNKIRAMSGEPPLGRQLLSSVGSALGQFGINERQEATGFVASLTSDIVRYAKMKGM